MSDHGEAASGFTVELWADWWKNPDLTREDTTEFLAADIVGHWPGAPEPVRGLPDYVEQIKLILAAIPDLRLELIEHATNGNLIFLHYTARGTGSNGPIEFDGIDRLRLRNGMVVDNLIRFDSGALLAATAPVDSAG